MKNYSITVKTTDVNLISNLFGSVRPSKTETLNTADGFQLTFEGMSKPLGVNANEIIFSFVISVAANVPSNLIANWIQQKLDWDNSSVMIESQRVEKRLEAIQKKLDAIDCKLNDSALGSIDKK